MQGFIYILVNRKKKYYIGSTGNLEKRLHQHEHGHTQTTKNMGAFKLIFKQKYPSLSKARIIEKRIKSWKRKDFIEKIIQDGYIKI